MRALLSAAFPGGREAQLVAARRAEKAMVMELVEEADGKICAYAAFSAMRAPARALGLGPVATAAPARGRGLATALVRDGLERLSGSSWRGVFVLGEPGFYGRLGFSTDAAGPFETRYPRTHMMARDLAPGSLAGLTDRILYAAAFDELS